VGIFGTQAADFIPILVTIHISQVSTPFSMGHATLSCYHGEDHHDAT
jgi:hypothetical protein